MTAVKQFWLCILFGVLTVVDELKWYDGLQGKLIEVEHPERMTAEEQSEYYHAKVEAGEGTVVVKLSEDYERSVAYTNEKTTSLADFVNSRFADTDKTCIILQDTLAQLTARITKLETIISDSESSSV